MSLQSIELQWPDDSEADTIKKRNRKKIKNGKIQIKGIEMKKK